MEGIYNCQQPAANEMAEISRIPPTHDQLKKKPFIFF